MKLPQLLMILPDTSTLPPLSLPLGFALHNHTVGKDESAWERIVEAAFGSHYGFDSFLVAAGGYAPENVLYISRNGTDIATTTAVENDRYPGFGWLRMVATDPAAQGHHAGRLAVLAALQNLAARGYRQVLLSTDDKRLPAIALYRSLGFEPYYTDESHAARWAAVNEELDAYRRKKNKHETHGNN